MVWRSKASGICTPIRVEHKNARSARGRRAFLVRVALADDQLIVAVAVEVGTPDGVAPLHGLGDHLTRPEPRGEVVRLGNACACAPELFGV